jgi:hypothetical protein
MMKALFGIVAGLALGVAPGWASGERMDEEGARAFVVTDGGTGSSGDVRPASDSASASEAGHDRAAIEETAETKGSRDPKHDEDRWMREREGYRDGGY